MQHNSISFSSNFFVVELFSNNKLAKLRRCVSQVRLESKKSLGTVNYHEFWENIWFEKFKSGERSGWVDLVGMAGNGCVNMKIELEFLQFAIFVFRNAMYT